MKTEREVLLENLEQLQKGINELQADINVVYSMIEHGYSAKEINDFIDSEDIFTDTYPMISVFW